MEPGLLDSFGADGLRWGEDGRPGLSRCSDWDLYVHQRTLLERDASANSKDVWNGRPISKVVLAEPSLR
jgi:hypothetical protein